MLVKGVLVLTINLGNFELIPSASANTKSNDEKASGKPNEDVIAVLVDGHDLPREGTILQHPLLQVLSNQTDPSLAKLTFQIDPSLMKQLQTDGSYTYIDPVSKDPRGANQSKNWIGDAYSGEWIATMRPVDISRRKNQFESTEVKYETNLYLLVQERTDAAVARFVNWWPSFRVKVGSLSCR